MRKRNLFVAAYLAIGVATATFTSCSNDDVWNENGIETPAEADAQQIVLQVSNSGDGMMTRNAGRPLYSSEARQAIDEVKLIICDNAKKSENVVFVHTFDKWNTTGSKVYGISPNTEHGREATLTIPDADKLMPGNYTVYAIGYNSNRSDYNELDGRNNQIASIQEDDTFNENFALTLASGKGAEEIFAGSLNWDVTDSKGFKESVVLNRQVAGAFFYVDDIPVIDGATKIRLVASSKNTKLILGKFANVDLPNNGSNTEDYTKYVINGTTSESGTTHIICQTSLSEWFKTPTQDDGTGLIKVEGNWKGDEEKYAKGSVFAGEFVIPFAKVTGSDNTTLTLQMVDDSGDVKRSWKVKLPASDGQNSDHTLCTWNSEESKFESKIQKDTQSKYNIVRNHLYTIGQRVQDTPDDPGVTPDIPESLDTKQALVLKVCDNWEVIHNMDIE